jgi:omega-amidase
MQNELKVVGIQADLIWENPTANRKQFSKIIHDLESDVDLIVLPEMFTSGFTMNPKNVAEKMEGDSISWMKQIAGERNAAIIGSLVIKEGNNYFNRLIFVHPSGKIETYDKRHLFTLAGEHKQYTAGSKKLIVNYKEWKICPLVCYDLRFPVWTRSQENYDLLIFIANWPEKRIHAWDILLKARAIENMSYVVGVNRVGIDENKHTYSGNSVVIDSLGNEIASLKLNEIGIITTTLNKDNQDKIRENLGFLDDGDAFEII